MSADELTAAALELVRRTTAAQGLPERLEDGPTISRVARLVTRSGAGPKTGAASSSNVDQPTKEGRRHGR